MADASSPHLFTVQEREFSYVKLDIRKQMKLWPRLAKDLGPLLPIISGEIKPEDFGRLVSEAAGVLEHAEVYLDALVGQAHTEWAGKRVAVKLFENQVFTDPGMVMGFIYHALQVEFGDFLGRLLSGSNIPTPSPTA